MIPVIDEISKDCGVGQIIDQKLNLIEYIDKDGLVWYSRAKSTCRMPDGKKIEAILWRQGPQFRIVKD